MIPFADVVDVWLERKGASWAPIFERRFRPLKGTFEQVGRDLEVDPALLAAIAKRESAFDVTAVGPDLDFGGNAVGLMQLIPSTASELGIDDRRDPVQSIRGGALDLLRKGYGDVELGKVLARYGGFVTADPTEYQSYVLAAWARFRVREGMHL